MDRTEAAVLKPIEAFYEDRIEIGTLKILRNIIALTEPLDEVRNPVGPALYSGPHPARNIRGKRYILAMDPDPNFGNCFPFRASDDQEAIQIANEKLSAA